MRLAMPLQVNIETRVREPRIYLPDDAVKTDDLIVGKVEVTAIVDDGGIVEMTIEGELKGVITPRPPTIQEWRISQAVGMVRGWEAPPTPEQAMEVAELLHLWAHPPLPLGMPEERA